MRSTLRTTQRSPFFTHDPSRPRSERSLCRVMTTSPALARVPSASTASRPGRPACACQPVIAGQFVQPADRVAAGGQEQARPAGGKVGSPGVECLVDGGAGFPDVDASLREVVLKRGRVAAPDAERRGRLLRVGEAVEFGEADRRPQRRALLGQVAEDATRGDRGQLLVVPDQADAASSLENTVDDGREVLGSHHPRLVDDDESARADGRERRHPAVARGGHGAVEELGDGLGGRVDRLAELVCCDRGGREPDDVPAATAPGLGEGGHRSGLAAPGRCQGDLNASPARGESLDQLGLTGVEYHSPAASRRTVRSTKISGMTCPSVRSAASRRRRSASRIAAEVYVRLPWTV